MSLGRRIAGFAVLGILVLVGIALVPPYLRNMQFQRWLDDLLESPPQAELLQAAVVNRAAQLGLPVRSGDVRVTRNGQKTRVEILYVVRVDLPLYTVDLHFHPAASN